MSHNREQVDHITNTYRKTQRLLTQALEAFYQFDKACVELEAQSIQDVDNQLASEGWTITRREEVSTTMFVRAQLSRSQIEQSIHDAKGLLYRGAAVARSSFIEKRRQQDTERDYLAEQMEKVQLNGGSNMFDRKGVQQTALSIGCFTLHDWIENHSVADYATLLGDFAKWKEQPRDK